MKKILVIEDEQDIREHLVKILQFEEFQAVGAENGLVGIEHIKRAPPDLIICDVLMPELSGYAVLTEVRTNPLTATIPFIFLTARTSQDDMRHGMKLGADDYLTKPFKVSDLLEAVHVRLEKHAIEVKQFDELRQNLSQTLPHELQTPLNTIIGFTDFLLNVDRAMFPDINEILEMQRSINEGAWRLEHLISNYLMYARLQMLTYDAEKRELWKAGNVLSNAEEFITSIAWEKTNALRRDEDVDYDVENATLQISETHLQKVLDEILDNACKFSEPGTPITIHGSEDKGGQYMLRISDRGRGMTAEQCANIGAYMQFERRRYEQQGVGLGLTIAQMLVRLHDGQFHMESVPEQGTTVTLTLKKAETLADA